VTHARNIASWFIKKAAKERISLDQMKLMKLVYIAQGIALACNTKLFEESIQAWKYGPVIETLYHEFKRFGTQNITPENSIGEFDEFCNTNFDDYHQKILLCAWESFKKFSGVQLSNWTHQENSPWYESWYHHQGFKKNNQTIDHQIITRYFKELIDHATSS